MWQRVGLRHFWVSELSQSCLRTFVDAAHGISSSKMSLKWRGCVMRPHFIPDVQLPPLLFIIPFGALTKSDSLYHLAYTPLSPIVPEFHSSYFLTSLVWIWRTYGGCPVPKSYIFLTHGNSILELILTNSNDHCSGSIPRHLPGVANHLPILWTPRASDASKADAQGHSFTSRSGQMARKKKNKTKNKKTGTIPVTNHHCRSLLPIENRTSPHSCSKLQHCRNERLVTPLDIHMALLKKTAPGLSRQQYGNIRANALKSLSHKFL